LLDGSDQLLIGWGLIGLDGIVNHELVLMKPRASNGVPASGTGFDEIANGITDYVPIDQFDTTGWVFAALGNQLFATVALLIATLAIQHELHLTTLWLPVLLIPQLIFALGVSWLIASLGVFLRDIAQGLTLLLMAWLYLTPIIYPESIVPDRLRPFINFNPFTPLVRSYRNIFLDGAAPDWRGLAYFTVVALVVCVFGYWWFARTRKNFADVI